jgi:predicted site-specific integrase-resolvase
MDTRESLKVLSSQEAAQLLGVADGTLKYWRSTGQGPAFTKYSRKVVYDAADVLAFKNEHRVIPSVRAHLERQRA